MEMVNVQFLETPWYGSRQMARHWRRAGYAVGRKRVCRLKAKMGQAPIYQRSRAKVTQPGHRVGPYLLRDLVAEEVRQDTNGLKAAALETPFMVTLDAAE